VGHLDEAGFAARVQGCASCGGEKLILHAYLDRAQSVMVGAADNDGRWAYDGEGFIDGVSRIECASCAAVAFNSDDCTRCHAPGVLPAVKVRDSRLAVPKKCPRCNGLEMSILGFAPSRTDVIGGRPGKAVPTALFGDPGFHVVAIGCSDCEWAVVAEGCAMCGAPSPIRRRPG
jgi:hypothetical protein